MTVAIDIPIYPTTTAPDAAIDIAIPPTTTTPADEALARGALRDQIARLEAELGQLVVSNRPPRAGASDVRPRGPQLLSLGVLERARDELADEVATVRRAIDERGRAEEEARTLREEMLLEPERHRHVRVSNADMGDPGCTEWQVSPSFGLLGKLMNWWRVRISSGCPLAGRHLAYRPALVLQSST
jgi:hypothetical protein